MHNCCRAIKEASACNKMEIIGKKEGWTPQVPGPLARWPGWHVVVRLSCDGPMISGGAQILWAVGVGVHSDQGSGHKLACNKRGHEGMVGHGQAWSGLIGAACGPQKGSCEGNNITRPLLLSEILQKGDL